MKGALRALVQRTIKVVLVVTRRIVCRMDSLLCGVEKCFRSLARFPVDFNGCVRQSPSVVASDSEGGMVGV